MKNFTYLFSYGCVNATQEQFVNKSCRAFPKFMKFLSPDNNREEVLETDYFNFDLTCVSGKNNRSSDSKRFIFCDETERSTYRFFLFLVDVSRLPRPNQ